MKRQWMGGIQVGFVIRLGMGLAACAADGTSLVPPMASTAYPPHEYAHRVESSQVALYWNCAQPEPGLLKLEGLAFNPWSNQPIRFLEFELAGVNDRERTVSEAKADARDLQIFTNQSTPFQLDLRTAGTEVRFDLYYQYRAQDRGHNAIVAGPVPSGSFLVAQQVNRFMARDVCSETQHRWR